MKKVLIVSTVSRQFYLFEQGNIKALKSLGYEVHGAANFSDANERLDAVNIKRHPFDIQRSPFTPKNIKAYLQLRRIMKKERFDMVHCHSPMGGVLARLAAKSVGITPVVYTAHGFHFYKGAPIINWLVYYPVERWLAKYTDILITINNEDYQNAINKKLKSKTIKHVNGIGIDLERFKPQSTEMKAHLRTKYGYKDNDFILIYAGELSYRKHQDLLFRVVHILKERIPNLRLLLAGTGDLLEDYKKQVESLGISKHVEFLGYRKDIPNLMIISDMAVSSSRQEGLPVNLMEAMATGLPLVVTNCRGNRDLINEGENGYVIEIDDEEGFANAVEKVFKSVELRKEFGKNSLEIIKSYSLDKVSSTMRKIYDFEKKDERKSF